MVNYKSSLMIICSSHTVEDSGKRGFFDKQRCDIISILIACEQALGSFRGKK